MRLTQPLSPRVTLPLFVGMFMAACLSDDGWGAVLFVLAVSGAIALCITDKLSSALFCIMSQLLGGACVDWLFQWPDLQCWVGQRAPNCWMSIVLAAAFLACRRLSLLNLVGLLALNGATSLLSCYFGLEEGQIVRPHMLQAVLLTAGVGVLPILAALLVGIFRPPSPTDPLAEPDSM